MVSSAWTRGDILEQKGSLECALAIGVVEGQIIIHDMVPYYVMVSLSRYLAGEKNGRPRVNNTVRLDVSGSGGSGNQSIDIHG